MLRSLWTAICLTICFRKYNLKRRERNWDEWRSMATRFWFFVDFSNFVVVNSVSKRTLRFSTCDDRGDSYLSFTSRDLVFLFCDWEVSRLVSSFNGRRRKKTKRLVNPSRRGLERTISHLLFGLEGWESHCCYFVALLVQSSCHGKWLFFRLVLR